MINQKVYADFHNADAQGRLRLNCNGTVQDLNRQQIVLNDNLCLTFYSEDIEAEGLVHFSKEEQIWVAVINWDEIKQVETEPIVSSDDEIVQRKRA